MAESNLEWIIGAFALFFTILGIVWSRLEFLKSRLELAMNALEDRMTRQIASGDDKLWIALQAHQESTQMFREKLVERVAMKSDLKDMEQRIIETIRNRKPRDAD